MSDTAVASGTEMHPEARARLLRIIASGEPPLESLSPTEARRLADARVMDNGMERAPMHEVRDIAVPGPAGDIPTRLYRPTGRDDLPLIIFIHGGGFMLANLDTHDALCRRIAAEARAAVLAIDYRLAPENPFPAAPEDCLAVTRWALATGEDLGADVSRFALAGESSGGNLAAVIANDLTATGGPSPRLQVMIYAAFDVATDTPSYERFSEGYFFTRSKAEYFWRHYLRRPQDAADPRCSPLRAGSLRGAPPALIITAGLDPLLSEGEAYAARLRADGVETTYHCFEGWPHGFLFWGGTEACEQALAMTTAALRAALA